MPTVTVLMATYNGERYIEEQVDSIMEQDFKDLELLVVDDCSRDEMKEKLLSLKKKYPNRMRVFFRKQNTGSASQNFFRILQAYRQGRFGEISPYIMCSDQDDIWLPDKVSAALEAMRELEAKREEDTPLLVHGDLTLVDSVGNIICPSMYRFQRLKGTGLSFNKQLIQNSITGCTVMMNRALLMKMRAIPKKAIMHDWWLGLIAAAFGEIGFMETPHIYYRQHDDNQEGAKNYRSLLSVAKLATKREGIQISLKKTYDQAQEFWRIYRNDLSDDQRKLLKSFVNIRCRNYFGKMNTIRRHSFWKSNTTRRLGQIFYT